MHTEPPEAGVDDDDRLIVELEGDLDVVSAGPVGDQLCGLVDVGELIIEIDCRAVTFIESRGLAMMARVQRLANESGCRLTWRALPLHALRTIHLSGLDEYLRIEA
jgi:anti-anti-sigma factor